MATKVLKIFLALISTMNKFIFNSKFYLQIRAWAMGTISDPIYANIFSVRFEQKIIYTLTEAKTLRLRETQNV